MNYENLPQQIQLSTHSKVNTKNLLQNIHKDYTGAHYYKIQSHVGVFCIWVKLSSTTIPDVNDQPSSWTKRIIAHKS